MPNVAHKPVGDIMAGLHLIVSFLAGQPNMFVLC